MNKTDDFMGYFWSFEYLSVALQPEGSGMLFNYKVVHF